MSYKLKHDSIDVFSKEISTAICDKFFQMNNKIDGNQLISITGSEQTNLLLVKLLFEKWQLEMDNLKSPYFDFEKEEIKTALSVFMKTLSKHIHVRRKDFEPLLTNAISSSVILHFDSSDFYENRLVIDLDNDVSISGLLELKKYLKFNSSPFFGAIKGLDRDEVTKKKLVKSIKEAYSNADLETVGVEDYLESLNAKDQIETLFEEEKVGMELEEVVEESPVEGNSKPAKTKVVANDDEMALAINEKFGGASKTLADELHDKTKKDIESSLNLNEKFMFINNLFGGDKEDFKSALIDLEASDDLEEAKSKVWKQYGSDWDFEGEEVEAFIEVLERRFS